MEKEGFDFRVRCNLTNLALTKAFMRFRPSAATSSLYCIGSSWRWHVVKCKVRRHPRRCEVGTWLQPRHPAIPPASSELTYQIQFSHHVWKYRLCLYKCVNPWKANASGSGSKLSNIWVIWVSVLFSFNKTGPITLCVCVTSEQV